MFPHGVYKTMIGYTAIVAQTKQIGLHWVLKGAIRHGNVYVMCHWNSYGKQIGGNTELDLMRSERL